ncbi:MAG: hypothetical protein JW882_07685 [Deltaproteobacteria bacterium]|nr:hypothetical protein [Deltaproteobacteria bacterium]
MNDIVKEDQWVYVIVQNTGGNEAFLGQQDVEKNISFIPAFLSSDDAGICLRHLKKDDSLAYEIHAILYEDLLKYASQNGLMVFLLNSSGEILKKETI